MKWRYMGVNQRSVERGKVVFDGIAFTDPATFRELGKEPVTVRASLYLSVFGNARSQTMPLRRGQVNVMDGLQCGLGAFNYLICRSAFGWPPLHVYVRAGSELRAFDQSVSYSPFPAVLNLDTGIEEHWSPAPPRSLSEVTIIVKEPLAHLRRDIEAQGIALNDLVQARQEEPER